MFQGEPFLWDLILWLSMIHLYIRIYSVKKSLFLAKRKQSCQADYELVKEAFANKRKGKVAIYWPKLSET